MDESIDLGNYILLQTIGTGGFSKVKLAEDKKTGKRFAIKIIKKAKLNGKPEMKQKIQREIALMKLLDHPHIIKLNEICESSRHLFIVLEYAENGELFDYLIARRSLTIDEAMRLFRQIIYGVDYLHNNSICHRDLKPENILLDANNNIKIADFGFARWLKTSTADTSCGSPHYAAPEVVKGLPYNGKKADIWSCGVILYALLSGRLPFNEPSYKELIAKIKTGTYRMPDFPNDVKDLVARLLTVEEDKRITIEQIKHHKAFHIGLPKYYTVPLPFPLPDINKPVPIKDTPEDILDTLRKIGFSEDEIVEELESEESNAAKSFWAILAQRVSVDRLPWCEEISNKNDDADKFSNDHPIFNENLTSKDPFFRLQRFSGSLCSLESPITSIVETAMWSPETSKSMKAIESVALDIKAPVEECIAMLQKEYSNKSIDWLFPDDEVIFTRKKDTYAYVYVTESSIDTSVVNIEYITGVSEVFSQIVEITCIALGVQLPIV